MKQFVYNLLDVIFPRSCGSCGNNVAEGHGHICWECRSQFALIAQPFCARCGDPADGDVFHEYTCSRCKREDVFFDRARSALRYYGSVKKAMAQFKYNAYVWLADDLSRYLEACVKVHYGQGCIDAIVSVPLFGRKERERTFNQSSLLARRLAKAIDAPFYGGSVVRTRDTGSQVKLNARQRRTNVLNAFRVVCRERIDGRSILLVDDVMTTGATVNECSKALKQAGAVEVNVITVARG